MEETILELARGHDRDGLGGDRGIAFDACEWWLDDRVRSHASADLDFRITPVVSSGFVESVQLHDDLPDVRGSRHPGQRVARPSKREDLVDDRSRRQPLERTVHLVEHLDRTDQHALEAHRLEQDRERIDLASRAGEDSDQAHDASGLDRLERARQRPRTAHLDHLMDALAHGKAQDLRVAPDGKTIYLADTGLFAFTPASLIVFDVASRTHRSVLTSHPSTQPQDWVIWTKFGPHKLVYGLVTFVVGVDGSS